MSNRKKNNERKEENVKGVSRKILKEVKTKKEEKYQEKERTA
jgi:hypothetical protein